MNKAELFSEPHPVNGYIVCPTGWEEVERIKLKRGSVLKLEPDHRYIPLGPNEVVVFRKTAAGR